MEVEGKVIVVLPERTGTSRTGNPWKVREYVLETTNEAYPRKIAFDFFGDRADQFPLAMGDNIKLSFDIESREYNGRWYTSIRGWKAEKAAATTGNQGPVPPVDFPGADIPPMAPMGSGNSDEDLPF